LKEGGKSLGFVPTMGALHAGHIKLVTEAGKQADTVAASIFVNPLQFGEHEDLDRYPRREEADAAMLAEAGCSLLWLPAAEQIYPDGYTTKISVAGVSERWEGEARPGHFDGVATVVAKLLVAMTPDVAQLLMGYSWPGNVRELRNVAERLVLKEPGHRLLPEHLPPEIREGMTSAAVATAHDVGARAATAERAQLRDDDGAFVFDRCMQD